MKRIKLGFVMLLLLCTLFLSGSAVSASMAHNIYMTPDLSKTSGGFDGFVIDFYAEKAPKQTYWAMCNWDMKGGFGAYAGFQNTVYGKNAILSFWEGKKNGKMITASRVYPKGSEEDFGGEGTGTHWLQPLSWKNKTWYRMLIYCWKDSKTGHTFVGEWVSEVGTNKWQLMSYFDTKLKNSYMTGELYQFQENFDGAYSSAKRKFRVKNIYALDHANNKWISLNKSMLSYDHPSWGYDTAGPHTFGAASGYFWGEAGGSVDNQEEYDATSPDFLNRKISQPSAPSFGKTSIKSLSVKKTSPSKLQVSWILGAKSNPVYKYVVEVYNKSGKKIASHTITRPEVKKTTISATWSKVSKVKLKATDIKGSTITKNWKKG